MKTTADSVPLTRQQAVDLLNQQKVSSIGARIGRSIARDVLAEDMPREWTGIDSQDGDQFLIAGIVADSPDWVAAEISSEAAYLIEVAK